MEWACENCRFFDENPNGTGLCRRYPPRPKGPDAEGSEPSHFQEWPWMTPDDWCGEFKSKGEPV